MSTIPSDILIFGGGAAGMSAALAASESGRRVTIVDGNPRLGGQIWRAELGKNKSPAAEPLIRAITSGKFNILGSTQVIGVDADGSLMAETHDASLKLQYSKLILATGARERFLPFPGWTLPGVFGAGGLQALVKGGFDVAGKSVLVAGTGPLLLVVAEYLKSKGANVVAIVEQTPASKLFRFGLGLWRSPTKLAQAFELRSRLSGIPYWNSSWITSIDRFSGTLGVSVSKNGRTRTLKSDLVACGFHLVPNTELASLLGCVLADGFVSVDNYQRTSRHNIYAVGEPTGIGGVEASLVEGRIGGYSATGENRKAEKLFARRDRSTRFAEALNEAFALRDELKLLADDETIVCRCEDVPLGKLTEFDSSRTAKLQTRCGMGPCQGRICGPVTEFLFGWEPGVVRPPIFPVKLEHL